MVTIRDVARIADVSIATVSRVLNDSEAVRPETRERVLDAIKALNYQPSSIARRLSIGRSFTIGVILPFFTRPSFVERLRGIEAALSYSEYDLVVYNVETPARRDAHFAALAGGGRFDGAIIMSLVPGDEDVRRWKAAGVPVVLVDAFHPALTCALGDDVRGGRLAAEHLISQGHRRLAFVGDTRYQPLGFTSSRHRLEGFRTALADCGIILNEDDILLDEHGRREARAMAEQLLARPPHERPTAVFAASDTQALGILDALRGHGLRAPDDLAVIGFDDIEVAEVYDLTTVRQPLYESGSLGAELLRDLLEQPDREPVKVELPLEVVSRGTA
ncbi:MAG TPA: LacI family transcriptional regulator [Chloroflexi bacterium]|nr:LacI family transcriptional regulator [Chloroflexota bacterium]